VQIKAVRPAEFERVIVDTTVQEKAMAHPVDSRLLEIARGKVVQAAKSAGISFKQTFVKEGTELRRRAGGYPPARTGGGGANLPRQPLRRTHSARTTGADGHLWPHPKDQNRRDLRWVYKMTP